MTTAELISYIKKQISNNVSKDLIISKLVSAGWHLEDINEGFSKVESSEKFDQEVKVEVKTVEPVKKDEPRVWVPHNLPVLEKKSVTIEEQELELPAKKEELIPTLMPKIVINSFGSVNKENFGKKEEPTVPDEPAKNYSIKDLPKVAMLSSYKKDVQSLSQINGANIKRGNKKIAKWLIMILVIVVILGGGIWAYSAGYLKISNINFPFIKKDPKTLILNNSKILSSLSSYKTETNIDISFPSFANISAGLVSGEAVPETDKDSFSINNLGIINQTDGNTLSDNFITIKSSLLENYITTDVKSNGLLLFVSVPDLSQIVKEDAPEPAIVKINEQQFDLIPPLFSEKTAAQLEKINFYKILSSGIPSYINNEILDTYDNFISNTEIIEKGQEKIKNVDTYHYSINADRESAKELLAVIANNFTLNLSEADKNQLNEILGATNIKSFDVWIGKSNSAIYQYSVVVEVPLSKIIGFEDRSIGDNKVVLSWQTTYYDFDVSNNIFIPEDAISVTDFVNTAKEKKIRNDVLSFSQMARSLFNAEGSYGKTANGKGSCMSPVSGSLFSPVGHSKGAVSAVSSLSELLNKILKTTEGVGACYSTTKAWSFTIPISDNYDISSIPTPTYESFLCVDSTGTTKDLITPPTGVICK